MENDLRNKTVLTKCKIIYILCNFSQCHVLHTILQIVKILFISIQTFSTYKKEERLILYMSLKCISSEKYIFMLILNAMQENCVKHITWATFYFIQMTHPFHCELWLSLEYGSKFFNNLSWKYIFLNISFAMLNIKI